MSGYYFGYSVLSMVITYIYIYMHNISLFLLIVLLSFLLLSLVLLFFLLLSLSSLYFTIHIPLLSHTQRFTMYSCLFSIRSVWTRRLLWLDLGVYLQASPHGYGSIHHQQHSITIKGGIKFDSMWIVRFQTVSFLRKRKG